MSHTPAYMAADELARLVRNPAQVSGRDYIVIDARDTDFVGGHIPGADNVPAHTFPERVEAVIDKYQRVPLVVFHCALSQVRGPKSAMRYQRAVDARLQAAPQDSPLRKQQIKILRGGFNSWHAQYAHAEPKLIEGFDQKLWDGQTRD
ncbi:Cdc25 phosphatase Ibp1 [Coemansia sp. BCRC 34301]|nr:Cdc25 phosphatase Ibp1 [Coemansia sp. BCRC 34301]